MRIIKEVNKKSMVFSEIVLMIISVFAFSFIVGGMSIGASGIVKAEEITMPPIPKGCCAEAKDGSVCQEMNLLDKALCKNDLLSTSCDTVSDCQIGCCYDANEGACSLNSPKKKCLANGGNWTNDAKCNIQECSLGCCILGDQASITTTRECTKISRDLNLQKNFQSLDSDGTCNSRIGLEKRGACVSPSSDFSSENECKFTTKGQCSGNFYEGFLCTAAELKTSCKPAKNTTCVDGKDQVYYLDTCGNIANVYDASKFNDLIYWTKIILPTDSCSSAGKDCGNCDYTMGSRCYAVREGRDSKPTYGNNICRNLNCANGKKHGESWCVSDYANLNVFGVSPIGSRFFKASCIEGEISIEPCADFNNEICIQNTLTGDSGGVSEAQCIINNWRSCISANEKESYDEIKQECDKYPNDCIMFADIPGNEKISDTETGLPGFKEGVENEDQGRAGDVGEDMNKVIAHCVPKYNPGMVFWSTNQNNSELGNGGSLEETRAICALGSFTCVAHKKKDSATSDWKWKENEICSNENHPNTKAWVEALNERCANLGPCGGQVNIAGEIGKNNLSSFTEIKINKDGKTGDPYTPKGYELSAGAAQMFAEKAGLIKAGSLKTLASAVILALITGRATEDNPDNQNPDATSAAESASGESGRMSVGQAIGTGVAVGTVAYTAYGTAALPAIGAVSTSVAGAGTAGTGFTTGIGFTGGGGSVLGVIGWAAVAAIAGYIVGQLVGKIFGFDGPSTQALSYALAAGAGVTMAVALSAEAVKGCAFTGGFYLICLAIFVIIAVLTYIFTYEADEYYIMSYTCEPWQAPQKGDCSLCNEDIRTCSEYRCKSLGQNCQYFNDNGEPGWCAETTDTWSAKISPWPKALSEGNTYTDVTSTHFTITGNQADGKVEAWKTLQFGIITDKPAQCRIDNKHTKSYDEMSTGLTISSEECTLGSCQAQLSQGLYHKVALSQHLGNSSGDSTLGMSVGENNYYIRCQNFAGQVNEAEFAVRLVLSEGPDLTPPIVTSFSPASGSYLKKGTNSTTLVAYVNEPSECKYSQKVDNRYEEMTGNFTCYTSPDMAVLGNWPCYTTLRNLEAEENNFYIQCKDQPNIDERVSLSRNINRNSKEYKLNICSSGLEITSLEPQNQIISGKAPLSVTLTAETSGCIENGKAMCYYSFNNGPEITFFNTDSISHSQVFENMPAGDNNITVICEDSAGNYANKSINIKVFVDNFAPNIIKAYEYDGKLTLISDEDSECRYSEDVSLACGFNFEGLNVTVFEGISRFHYTPWAEDKNYYIKCRDLYNNTNLGCGIMLKTYKNE
jgi:hypothetical protein